MAKAVAANPQAARAVGVPAGAVVLLMATLGGALSGLAGFTIVCGEEHKLTQFVGNDFIFPSIVIAYLARSNPLGVVVAAIGIAALVHGGGFAEGVLPVARRHGADHRGDFAALRLLREFLLRYRLDWVKTAKVAA